MCPSIRITRPSASHSCSRTARRAVLLTQTALTDGLPRHAATTVCLDEFDWAAGEDSNLQIEHGAGDLVYAIYTSGSTGQPKGVLMHNQALANLLQWQQTQPRLNQPASTLQFASFSFDVSFQELFSTWQQGGTLVMIDEELRRDLPGLARLIAAEEIERLFLPYAASATAGGVRAQRPALKRFEGQGRCCCG